MRVVRRGIAAGTIGLALGCYGDKASLAISVPAGSALGRVATTARNAILAVGGSLQIGVTAMSLTGEPVTRFDSVLYVLNSLADSARVALTHGGLMTGLAATSAPVVVNAVAFLNGTMQGDQVLVQVTPTTVSGLALSIQPPSGDSTKIASGTAKTILPIVRNPSTGASVAGVTMQYDVKPADENRLGVYVGGFRLPNGVVFVRIGGTFQSLQAGMNQVLPYVAEGTAWVYADLNAYGTHLRDSVLYSFTYPYVGTVVTSKTNLAVMTTINGGSPALSPGLTGSVTLAPGAIVTFSNNMASTDPLTITYTFDNPAAATAPATSPSTTGGASGNVTPLVGGQSSRRQFLTPGTYHWTTIAAGGPAPWAGQTFAGTIVVK